MGASGGQAGSLGHRGDPGGGPRALLGATRPALIACQRLSFFPLQAQTLYPRGAQAPQLPFGGPLQQDERAPHPAPSPTSHSGAGATAAAHGHKDPEELAEAGDPALQGAGRRRIPGHEGGRQRARPAAAVGRLEASERRSRARAGARAAAAGVGAGGWDQSWGGTDAQGARPGSRGHPRWPSPPCSRRVVFWLPRLLNAS